jgi:AcrR family transcriptional regulator
MKKVNKEQIKRNSNNPEELSPEIRKRIEEAVLDVFSKADFHKADIRTVAKKASVSFGTIYKYYGSKEKLLFAVIDGKLSELIERVIDHLKGIEDIKEKMRKTFWLQLDYYERNQNMGRILFMTVPLATWMADKTFVQRKLINIFLNVLRQGQEEGILNPNVRAGTLLDFMYGLVHRSFYMWIYRGQKESLSGQANILFDLMWRSICNPEK